MVSEEIIVEFRVNPWVRANSYALAIISLISHNFAGYLIANFGITISEPKSKKRRQWLK